MEVASSASAAAAAASSPAMPAAAGLPSDVGAVDSAAPPSSPSVAPPRRGRKSHALDGLDPRSVLEQQTSEKHVCPICADSIPPFADVRALQKHFAAHQRAMDEEDVRTAKPISTAKPKPISHKKGAAAAAAAAAASSMHSLLAMMNHSASGKGKRKGRPKAVVSSAASDGSESGGEDSWLAQAFAFGTQAAPTKARKKKKNQVEEEGNISEEERRQSALRREQKKLNAAAAAAGGEPKEEESEDVRCCLCHQADSDETNQIVMCDGPCDLPFHQVCFGVDHIPKGKWFCSTACKTGRRIDRVEHLSAHRIRYQRRRRQMANNHNAREQALLNEFWNSVNPYFDSKLLTQHGHELLKRSDLTADLLAIPQLGRSYKETWVEEDERLKATYGRGGRAAGKAIAEGPAATPLPAGAVAPAAAAAAPSTPALGPVSPAAADIGPPSEPVGADAAAYFATEGCQRLHQFLARDPQALASLTADEIARMERVASKPHTASVSVLAYVSSTAPKVDKPEVDPSLPIDLDAREPFDRSAYFFPSTHDNQWVPPPSVVKRQESVDQEERASLEDVAEHLFAQVQPTSARYLTGAHKDKTKHHHAPTANGTPAAAATPSKPEKPKAKSAASSVDSKLAAVSAAVPASAVAASAVAASSPAAPAALSSGAPSPPSSGRSSPEPIVKRPTASSSPIKSTAEPAASTEEEEEDDGDEPMPAAKTTERAETSEEEVDAKATRVEKAAAVRATDSDGDIEMEPVEEKKQQHPTKGAKQPRGATAASSTSAGKAPRPNAAGKAPKSAGSAAAAGGAHAAVGGKAPKSGSTTTLGGKQPRKDQDEKKSAINPKKAAAAAAKAKKSAAGDSEDESSLDGSDSDADSMTLSEEEDLRAEQEDVAAEAEAQQLESQGHGLGAGKGPGTNVPAQAGQGGAAAASATGGKQPRGGEPVTSDRSFSMAPRRNDDVACEEIAAEPIEELEAILALPTAFFDLRAVDFSSAPDMGLKLPHPKQAKAHHQAVVESFPYAGGVSPAVLASSCHYAHPPMLYNMHTMTLTDGTSKASDEKEEEDDSKADTIESIAALQAKIAALQAEFEIVEVARQQPLIELARQATIPATPVAIDDEEEKASVKVENKLPDEADSSARKFNTTASSRRDRASRAERGATAPTAPAGVSSVSALEDVDLELDTSQLSRTLSPSASFVQLASLAVEPAYDDEISAELWLAQRQVFVQSNHNNYVRDYLEDRARASGDWKTSLAQIDQKERSDKDTLQLYEESFLLFLARQQRESRRAKYEVSEAGQIRNIKRYERTQIRNQRHIQRLLKSMVIEVERRDKKRVVNERRDQSVAEREAKRQRRQAQEAQWKNRREAENFQRCENVLDRIIKQIEKEVEGKTGSASGRTRKPKDPNAPKRQRKKKQQTEGEDPNARFCVCHTPYDNDRFYLGCDQCNGWFHGRCVGVTEGQAEDIDKFICPPCQKTTGKETTYLDTKRERAKATEEDDEEEASSSAASSSSEEESEEEDLLRPIRIARTKKKGGKIQYKYIPPPDTSSDSDNAGDDASGSEQPSGSDEEEEDGSGSEADSDAASEAASDEEGEEEEEEEEEDDSVDPIRIKRFSTAILRLRRLPDTDALQEYKTRKAKPKHYEFAGLGAWSALAVTSDAHSAAHEQGARQLLRRFRRHESIYPTAINSWLVRSRQVTPTLPPQASHRRKKFVFYKYRFHTLKVVRVDKEAMVVTIRKIDDPERKQPNENAPTQQHHHHEKPTASEKKAAPPAAQPAARPAAAAPTSRPAGRPVIIPKGTLVIDCPLCSKACLDQLGILRHYAKAHFGLTKPNPDELAVLAKEQIARNKAKEANGEVIPTAAAPASHKRKRVEEEPATASIKTPSAADSIDANDADTPTPRGGAKRSRATPSPTPSPSPLAATLANTPEEGEDQDVDMADDALASLTAPLSGGSAAASRNRRESPAPVVKPFKLGSLKVTAQQNDRGRAGAASSTGASPSPRASARAGSPAPARSNGAGGAASAIASASNHKRTRDETTDAAEELASPGPASKQRRRSTAAASPSPTAASPSPTPSTDKERRKPRNELERLLEDS